MPIRTRCSCGRTELHPDVLEGKEVRCRKCRQRVTVQGERVQIRNAVSWPKRLLFFGLAIAAAGGVFTVIMFAFAPHFTPVMERYENGSGAAVDPKLDDPRIRSVIQAAADALTERQVGAFAEQFHYRRMLAEIEKRGGLALITLQSAEERVLEELDPAMREFCGQQYDSGLRWHPVSRMSIRYLPGRGEAQVTAVVRSADEFLHYRFWMIKENEAWKIFDFQNMGGRARASTGLGRLLRRAAKEGEGLIGSESKTRERIKHADSLLDGGSYEEALQMLDKVPAAGLKPYLEVDRQLFRSVALTGLEKHAEALAAIDRALVLEMDLPVAVFMRSRILRNLRRHEEAIRATEQFLELVGPDAEACVWIATLCDELQKPERADEIFQRMLRQTPELAEELPTIDGFKDFKGRPAIAEALKQAKAKIPSAPK